MRGHVLDLIKSYCSDRFQRVSVNLITSESLFMTFSVPQVFLVLYIFSLYINDMLIALNDVSKVVVFADVSVH